MTNRHLSERIALTFALLATCAFPSGRAQSANPKALVAAAVRTELESNRTDHTAYMYRDHDVTPEHDTVHFVVETPEGALKRKLADHAHPMTAEERHLDDLRIHALLNDVGAQQKQKRDSSNDDQQAEQMLKLLPTAFLWSLDSEHGDLVTLNFKPDPAFTPSTLEARVLSAMAGQITIAKGDDRIRTIKGTLVDDVKFGYGFLGRLKKGGTFQVERREVVPHHWQVTESHVHLDGRALFFKTIGSQEDETKSDFVPSPALTLKQAFDILEQKKQ